MEEEDFSKNYTLEVKWYKDNCKNDVNDGESANIMAVKIIKNLNFKLLFSILSHKWNTYGARKWV